MSWGIFLAICSQTRLVTLVFGHSAFKIDTKTSWYAEQPNRSKTYKHTYLLSTQTSPYLDKIFYCYEDILFDFIIILIEIS
jgi:hypothetical protein